MISGAVLAWAVSRKRSSLLLGSILATYFAGSSLLLYSTLGERLIRYIIYPRVFPPEFFIRPILGCLIAIGCITGGVIAGYLEKKQVTPTET